MKTEERDCKHCIHYVPHPTIEGLCSCECWNCEYQKRGEKVDKVQSLKNEPSFVNRNCGTNTFYYEISKEEYERITAMDNWQGVINEWAERDMSDSIRWGYGFYGCGLRTMDGKYYYTETIGNSCD